MANSRALHSRHLAFDSAPPDAKAKFNQRGAASLHWPTTKRSAKLTISLKQENATALWLGSNLKSINVAVGNPVILALVPYGTWLRMNHREAAICLLQDFDAHSPGSIFARSELNLSINDAYDLQFEVAALRESRGERVAGYKIGCISETMQSQLGIDHPVFGHVWDTEIYRSGIQLDAEDFDELAIEGELAIRLLDDVPSALWLRNNPEVVSDHFAVIELHNYVFRGPESNRAVELVTNNAIHAGVVIASEDNSSKRFNPNAVLRVDRNEECLGAGVADHLQRGPIDVVATVSEHLERRGLNLKRDQIVLTGSPLPLWKVAPGDRITLQCDGLSDVCCTIAEGS